MDPASPSTLAAPGAGIPAHERWLGVVAIRGLARLRSVELLQQDFDREAKRVLELAGGLTEALGGRPVLIPRYFGIEDSSRRWSVFMTLRHLTVVDSGIAGLIGQLGAGRNPRGEVRIQDVKPERDCGPEQLAALEAACRRYRVVVAAADLSSAARHAHPWFGPLTARQWHALAAIHHRIHRRQIELIIERVG